MHDGCQRSCPAANLLPSSHPRAQSLLQTGEVIRKLNKTHLHNEEGGKFNRGSFYFRPQQWSVGEMVSVMSDIAERSVLYYFSKYREDHFRKTE